MAAETWMTAEEAMAAGFVDTVFTASAVQNKAWDLSAFNNAPKIETTEMPSQSDDMQIAHFRDTAKRRLRLLQID